MRSFFRRRRDTGSAGLDGEFIEAEGPLPPPPLRAFRDTDGPLDRQRFEFMADRPPQRRPEMHMDLRPEAPDTRLAEPGPVVRHPAERAEVPRMTGSLPRSFDKTEPLQKGRQTAASENEETLPRFNLPVASSLRSSGTAGSSIDPELNRTLREAFTPTRPKQEVNGLFVGRLGTLRRIIAAIEEERAHVVVYGDRGRGKTSLANAIEQIAGQAGYLVIKLTCSAELSFEDMFRAALKRVPSIYTARPGDAPFSSRRNFNSFDERLPQGGFSVTQLNEALAEIGGTHVLLILDEYDRVTADDVKNKLAELFKNLTDSSIAVTLLVVGVAETVDHLLGKHPSIQRALVAVHLPLMTDREIERIILAGAETAGMEFAADVRQRIVALAKGLPYYAQLLSLHAARGAVVRGSREVERGDLAGAISRCVHEAERGLIEDYHHALGPTGDRAIADILYMAAQCPADEYGSFRIADTTSVSLRPGTRPPPLEQIDSALSGLCEGQRPVFQRVIVAGGHRYRFRNQMMRQFVLLIQAEERGLL